MLSTNYVEEYAMPYEFAIRIIYNCGRNGKPAADADLWRSLNICGDQSLNYPENRDAEKRYQKMFKKVKGYLVSAFSYHLKMMKKKKLDEMLIEKISFFLQVAESADVIADLEYSMDLFNQYKESRGLLVP